jgi:hypothetical protein
MTPEVALVFAALFTIITNLVLAMVGWRVKNSQDNKQAEIQSQYDAKLANLQGEITRNQSIFTAAISNSSYEHQAAHERRLKAIEIVWQQVSQIHRKLGIVTAFCFVDRSKIEADLRKDEPNAFFKKDDLVELGKLLDESYHTVAYQRPFLGEALWFSFFAYRAVLIALKQMVIEAIEKRTFKLWTEDDFLLRSLELAFYDDPSIVKPLKSDQILPLVTSLEERILQASDRLISGEIAAKDSVERSNKIVNALNELEIIDSNGLRMSLNHSVR